MDDIDEVLLTFIVRGDGRLIVPELATPERTDGLWATTCFECFLRPAGGDAYYEYNFSPSGLWAAYAFDGHRSGLRDLPVLVEPHVSRDEGGEAGTYVCDVDLDLANVPNLPVQLALSAVIEEMGGRKSYWALAHPPGKPDFHHPDCFVAELTPPEPA